MIAINKNLKNKKIKNISDNSDKKNLNKQDKLQDKLDKKILRDKLKEMKKKEAAIKKRIKMMDRDLKKDDNLITEEIYSQNESSKNKKLASAKIEKNSQNNEKNLDADTLNIINFSNN